MSLARSNNVGIMLARLRMSPSKIVSAILSCDDDALSADDLAALARMLPTADEASRFTALDVDSAKLAKPDAFLRQLSTVPHLKERLETMVFKLRFDAHVAEMLPDLAVLRAAAMEMKTSKAFHTVVRVVLELGNKLNEGTFRGAARGFKLDALLKVGPSS
jgi:hypothetical protein